MKQKPFFSYATAAERYARSRPYFHPLVSEKIKQRVAPYGPIANALDVACGTGQSTRALIPIARRIMGMDISAHMLAFARADLDHAPAMFVRAPAEALPVRDGSFDLATVSLAFHWFDRERFLREAQRVLRPDGWLVIYNNWFTGHMRENKVFQQWNRECYLSFYPTPPRNNQPFTDEDAAAHGFTFVSREEYVNAVAFTTETLANYLMTQSNVIACVEQGRERAEDVYSWLMKELEILFPHETCMFDFGGYIWCLQKA
jgi:SAM-dependent methyltransferase